MSNAITEISPLLEGDCFFIVDRKKSALTYPLHHHPEYELNYLLNAEGAYRIVGDKKEVIGREELALIGGEDIEHVWEQGECVNKNIREITIQFPRTLFPDQVLSRTQFAPIKKLLERSSQGLVFQKVDIDRVRDLLYNIPHEKDQFVQFLKCLYLLYQLGISETVRELSSSPFATAKVNSESRRVQKIEKYIRDHFGEKLALPALAAMVNMTPSSFSRFFRLRACKSLTEYITEVRLGYAARLLVNTEQSISEICYKCGYNNISNFNRRFKERYELTPGQFRSVNKKLGTVE